MAQTSSKHSLINDYLTLLRVPHTQAYSNNRYASMPFHTLFGFSRLLQEYGVNSEGYKLTDKTEIRQLTPPFLAHTSRGFVIVTEMTDASIGYMSEGVNETMPFDEFLAAWDGNVLLSFPHTDAREPDYHRHRGLDFIACAKQWVLMALALSLLVYMFVTQGLYHHVSTYFIALIDLGGIYFTYLLVQKSLNIHNPAADKVCSVLQSGGCDSILSLKASKFFGIFGWSEVGFSYFSVSLLAMLLYPYMLPWLALCNVCCLPFTVWSIWYQRFKAHKWCTLCVCVQCSLWLLFFCYLFGGWLRHAWPPAISFWVLGVCYVTVMLAINAVMTLIGKVK